MLLTIYLERYELQQIWWRTMHGRQAAAVPGAQVAGVGAQRALALHLGRFHLPRALLPGKRRPERSSSLRTPAGCCYSYELTCEQSCLEGDQRMCV